MKWNQTLRNLPRIFVMKLNQALCNLLNYIIEMLRIGGYIRVFSQVILGNTELTVTLYRLKLIVA